VWSADSSRLYFVSNPQGPSDIYGVGIGADGGPRGEVTRLTTGLGAYSIAFAPDRTRLAYTALATRANLWTLPIPSPGTLADVADARPLTTGNQLIEAMNVTLDGKWLVYDSTLYGNADIFRIPIGGGTPVRLTDHPADDFAPAVSPDGRLLAFHSWRTKTRDVFVQAVAGGEAQQLTATPRGEGIPIWLRDGSVVYIDYEVREGKMDGGLFVVRRDAAGAWARPEKLALPGDPGPPVVTRDGRFVFPSFGFIDIARVGDATATRIYQPSGSDAPMPERVALDDDERHVYFKAHDKSGRASFWSVPITGGSASPVLRLDDLARPSRRWDFAVSGGRLYFTIDERRSNIWIADVEEQPRD
jgi:dipeptidyl aminopeptidase/acylaminoacyl peptidase